MGVLFQIELAQKVQLEDRGNSLCRYKEDRREISQTTDQLVEASRLSSCSLTAEH